MDNGDIYLFYRHGAHRSNWVYQMSKDNGRTFSPKVSIVKAKPTAATAECSDIWDSWYLNFRQGNENDIIVSYNYHVCKNMKPHYSERNNTYYMTFDTDSNKWYNIKGQTLKLPLTKAYADTMTLAVNTWDKWIQTTTSSLDGNGHAHLSFYQGEGDGSVHGSPKQLAHYQWTGKEWIGGSTNLPIEARGEMKVTTKGTVSFLLGNNEGKSGEVAWWNRSDGNKDFIREDEVISAKGGVFKLSNFIRDAHPDARIIATQKVNGTDYSRVYLLGDKGPIQRSKSEAQLLRVKDSN
jgi:hypothetical protein